MNKVKCAVLIFFPTNGVFPLPDSDSYTDSYEIGFNDNVQNCFHWTYFDSYSDSYFDANGYCTQFDTDIGTDRWNLSSFHSNFA